MEIIKLIVQNFKWVIILIIIFTILKPISTSFISLLDRLAPAPRAGIFSSQTIINSIKEMGELVTISAKVEKQDVFIDENGGWIQTG